MYFCGHQFRPCFPFPFFHRKCTKHFLYMESYIFWIFLVPFFVWTMNVWLVWFYDMDCMVLLYLWIYGCISLGNVMGIMVLGKWGISLLWGSERYHCFGKCEGYHGFEKVRGITVFGVCMAWHGFMCRVTWLGMALCAKSMAWHGFVCREHGLAWLCVQRAWLGMALSGGCMAWHGFICRVAWLAMALSGGCMAWHGFEGCWDLCLHVAQRVWTPKNRGLHQYDVQEPGLMPARSLKSLNSEGSGLTSAWCLRTRLMPVVVII